MSVVITGAHGFLGWHVRVVAHANSLVVPHPLGRGDEDRLVTCVDGADRVVHLAGGNRGTPAEVVLGNTRAASALAHAIRTAHTPPKTVVFANSILGITVSFDKHGDVPAAKFYVSQIQSDGSHKLVG